MLTNETANNRVLSVRNDLKWTPLLFPRGPKGDLDEDRLAIELSGFNRLQEGTYVILRRYAVEILKRHGGAALMAPVTEVVTAIDATIKRISERLLTESPILEAALKWAENRQPTTDTDIDLLIAVWNVIGDQEGCTRADAIAELEEKRSALHNGSIK